MDRVAIPEVNNRLGADVGLDAKIGVTQGLTAASPTTPTSPRSKPTNSK
jgi:hypothetical protein